MRAGVTRVPVATPLLAPLAALVTYGCGSNDPIREVRGPSVEHGPLTLTPVVYGRREPSPIPSPSEVDAE